MRQSPATPQQKPQNNESQEHNYFFSEISPADRQTLDEPRKQVDPCVWCGGRLLHADLCVTNSDEFQPKLGFGEHKTKSVRDVPPKYLQWALNTGCSMSTTAMTAAIEVLRTSGITSPSELLEWELRLAEKESA